jgi:hypothetical protein
MTLYALSLCISPAVPQVCNYCQAMLLNRCRQRRRLRRCLDDWGHLYHHGVNADITAPFQRYLKQVGGNWTPEHPEDVQVSLGWCCWCCYEVSAAVLVVPSCLLAARQAVCKVCVQCSCITRPACRSQPYKGMKVVTASSSSVKGF